MNKEGYRISWVSLGAVIGLFDPVGEHIVNAYARAEDEGTAWDVQGKMFPTFPDAFAEMMKVAGLKYTGYNADGTLK